MTNDWQKKWSDSKVSSDSSNCAKTNHFRRVSIRFYTIRRVGLVRHAVLTTFLAYFFIDFRFFFIVIDCFLIFIFKLCNDKRLAEEVVRLEGLVRLVELCKNESARVGSDGVLVACLAAVRKIAAAVGPEKFKNLDATELVEPRLLDSFLIFSSRNESFV